jgi:hypothetical protein
MSFQTSRTPIYQLKFNAGDPFVVHWVYPALDAPGMGQGDLLTGDNPTPVWLHQKSEPIHIWGNTLYTVFSVATLATTTIGSPFASMKVGTDILNSAPTDYSAYTYPHPLTLGTNAVVVVAAKNLIPPTDLNVSGP